jgi:hypothetical protein
MTGFMICKLINDVLYGKGMNSAAGRACSYYWSDEKLLNKFLVIKVKKRDNSETCRGK